MLLSSVRLVGTQLRTISLQWCHNGRDGVSNHQHHNFLLNRLFRRTWKKTSKRRVTGLCAENSSATGEFPAQMASNAENVSIWWRHHEQEILNAMHNPLYTSTTTWFSGQFIDIVYEGFKSLSTFLIFPVPGWEITSINTLIGSARRLVQHEEFIKVTPQLASRVSQIVFCEFPISKSLPPDQSFAFIVVKRQYNAVQYNLATF